jgi:Phosphotransferase enzyme family
MAVRNVKEGSGVSLVVDPVDADPHAISDRELIAALEARFARGSRGRTVESITRQPSIYATSCPVEDVDIVLKDGERLRLILKNATPEAMFAGAKRVKITQLMDPKREVAVYERIIGPIDFGAKLFAASTRGARQWLLLEKIQGRELYQCELPEWQAAARCLARLHTRFGDVPHARLARQAHLLRYDRAYYRVWLDRAMSFFAEDATQTGRATRASLHWLAKRYDQVLSRLLSLPRTFIHGECFASNVLIADGGKRVCPIDWEMSAIGPGLMDIAALAFGNWSDEDRHAIVNAYVEASGQSTPDALASAIEAVEYCQIHLGVLWLGWFGRRRPPEGHTRDWAGDVHARAVRLGL